MQRDNQTIIKKENQRENKEEIKKIKKKIKVKKTAEDDLWLVSFGYHLGKECYIETICAGDFFQ